MGIRINRYKDSYYTTSITESKAGFFHCSDDSHHHPCLPVASLYPTWLNSPFRFGIQAPDLQEMANVSFGLRTLLCWCRLAGWCWKNLDFPSIIWNSPLAKMTKQKTIKNIFKCQTKVDNRKKHLQFFQMWYWELRTFVVCFSKITIFCPKRLEDYPPPPGKLTCPMKRDGKKTWIWQVDCSLTKKIQTKIEVDRFDYWLEPQTTIYKWTFGETTISYIKIWNHPIETTIY